MRWSRVGLLAGALFFWPGASGAAVLDEARQALNDGFPSVAIYKLQQADGKNVTGGEKTARELLLAQAFNAAGRYAETLALLDADSTNDEARILLARAMAAQGQRETALGLYAKLVENPNYAAEATVGRAAMLQGLDRTADAKVVLLNFVAQNPDAEKAVLALAEIQVRDNEPKAALETLAGVTQPSAELTTAQAFLSAKARLALGEVERAGKMLQAIQNPPPAIAGEVRVAQADHMADNGDLSAAEKVLEKFIDEDAVLPGLANVFAALDGVYQRQGAASGTELRRWMEDTRNQERAALALLYLARSEARNSKVDRSRTLYREFLEKYPDHPLAGEARTGLAASFLAAGDNKGALEALAGAPDKGEAGFLRGLVFAAQNNYADAAKSFELAAETPELKANALYNAAVCASLAGVPEDKNAAMQAIAASESGKAVIDQIRLDEALYLAAQRQPGAADLLRKLAVKDSELGRRAGLALAEWSYLQLDLPATRAEMTRVANAGEPADKERLGYLGVFLADTGGADADAQTIALTEAFLNEYPDSAFAPEVRMKLAEVLFRRGDYLGARNQFDKVEEEAPTSPLAEKAIFLSAQAMARSMDKSSMEQAIERYEDVVKGGGPLAMRARFSEAAVYNALDRPKDALGIFDRILESNPEAELRYATLIEKGDTLFSGGAANADNYKQAISTWQTVASDPAAPSSWRNQALTKMGETYEKLGDRNAALNCYYSVFSQGQKGEPEYFWFYRAGFDAGDLLRSQKLWNEAIAVYEKLGSFEGPRAEEARDLVNTLRLENFLWEN